jgi:hypothetical protein
VGVKEDPEDEGILFMYEDYDDFDDGAAEPSIRPQKAEAPNFLELAHLVFSLPVALFIMQVRTMTVHADGSPIRRYICMYLA